MSRDQSSQAEASPLRLQPALERWGMWRWGTWRWFDRRTASRRALDRPLRARRTSHLRGKGLRWARLWRGLRLPSWRQSLGLALALGGTAALVTVAAARLGKSGASRHTASKRVATKQAKPSEAAAKLPPPRDTPKPVATAAALMANQTAASEHLGMRRQAFGDAGSFHEALRRAGLAENEVAPIESAWRGLLDFRRCQRDDQIFVFRRSDGRIDRLHYHPSGSLEVLDAKRSGLTWQGEKRKLPVTSRTVTAGGVVRTTMGEAMIAAGLHTSLVSSFVELFAGRADFNADSRPGDSFRVVVEEKRLNGAFMEYGPPVALEYRGAHLGTLRALRYAVSDSSCRYFDEHGRALQGQWMRVPLRYDSITSRFNPRRLHPILRRVVPHLGVDFAAAKGTPIWAAAPGRVSFAGRSGASGNLVALRHANGYETLYAHLLRFHANARRGNAVQQGQLIGYVGSTGRSTGPHLHFGVRHGGRFVDPLVELRGTGRPMNSKDLPAFKRHAQTLLGQLQRIDVSNAS